MATIKLKKKPGAPAPAADRAPVRGVGAGAKGARPTLAQAQALRAEREARYQEQLRQRFGDRPPEGFQRRDTPAAPPRDASSRPPRDPRRDAASAPQRDARRDAAAPRRDAHAPPPRGPRRDSPPPGPNTAFGSREPRRDDRPPAPQRFADARAPVRRDDDFRARPPASRDEGVRPRSPARGDDAMGQRPPSRRDSDARQQPARHGGDARQQPFPRGDDDARLRPPPRRDDPRAAPTRPHGPRTEPPAPPRRDARAPVGRGPARYRDDDDDDEYYEHPEHAPGSMRLSKRMSELGIASRREADEWIAKGYVRVDDKVVSELGSRVMPDQRITIDAKAKFQQAQRVTVLVNKPVGYVSGQAEDGYEPALVLVQPQNQWREDRSGTRFLREHLRSLVPAGRLDIDSVGLLVLTQDGRVAKQLIGEDSEVDKEYLVRVAMAGGGRLPESGLALLRHGLELDGEALRPAQVEWANEDQLRFVLNQGKKRQIRRMCEAVGLQVLGLKRVRIGKVMLGDLPAGQWRYLRLDESF